METRTIIMPLSLFCLLFLIILQCAYAPPVKEEKPKGRVKELDSEIKEDLELFMEYHRYLKEIVQTLESDPDFRERLEQADEDDVRTGKIAEQLDFVGHNVRTKLDEIKRREIQRLKTLAGQRAVSDPTFGLGVNPNEYLDHLNANNPHTFEIEDLKKLIKKTTEDLEEADRQRKEKFKEYEMQKEFEKQQKLEKLDELHKNEYMEKLKQEEEAKKHHKPIHHPGSKQQLEEVWEKTDHMTDQQFDPKAFFMTHDVDGNGLWDADEVKALFIKELDKLYGPGGPNKDMNERAEEMERMREHVFRENDRNHDGLIDFHEFMLETQKSDFQKDEGWKSIDENQIYTHDEYEQFEKRRQAEIQYLQQHGLLDAQGRPMPGAHHALAQYEQQKQQMYQQQMAQGQMPQQGQVPQQPQGYNQYQVSQGQYPPQGGQPQQGYQPQLQQSQQAYQQPQQAQNVNQGLPRAHMSVQMPQQAQAPVQIPQGVQQAQVQAQIPQGMPQQAQGHAQIPQGMPQQAQAQAQIPQGMPQQAQAQAQIPQGMPQQAQAQAQIPQGMPQQAQAQAQIPQGMPQLAQAQAPIPQGMEQQARPSQ